MRAPRSVLAGVVAAAILSLLNWSAVAGPADLDLAPARAQAAAAPSAGPIRPAATVDWPPSNGLVIAEVTTGGVAATDEFVEIVNVSDGAIDLAGLEIAYASASGLTVSRRAAWTESLFVPPGGHVLLANASGAYAARADLTYVDGISATGGSIVIRATGGSPSMRSVGGTPGVVEGRRLPRLLLAAASNGLRARGAMTRHERQQPDFLVNPAPSPESLRGPPPARPRWTSASPTTTAAPSGVSPEHRTGPDCLGGAN
jgi:hypothetical protein